MKVSLPILISAVALHACSKTQPEPVSSSAAEATASTAASPTPAAAAAPNTSAGLASVLHPELLDPSKATAKAPDAFKAKFTTTKGDFVIQVHRDWSPNGADRVYNLVKMGFFDDTRFFRAVDGFMVQFGISGDPAVAKKWQEQGIADDPAVKQSNKRGFVTFAQRGTPNTRATQIFVNYGDNSRLDATFIPFAQVVQGMEVVDSLYKGYGEGAPMGAGPDQGLIQAQGNAYLDAKFPKLDGIKHAEIIP
jgi:peptidyl-prolyl cis-trans isomerase A (cyclophilin A)